VTASLKIPKGSRTGSYSLRAVAPELGLVSNSIVMGGVQAAVVAPSGSSYATFFQLDGNANSADGTGHDWSQVYHDFAPHQDANVSGTGAINFFNDPVPVAVPGVPAQTEDTFSGGNSKDTSLISDWTYNSSAPQTKANLENA